MQGENNNNNNPPPFIPIPIRLVREIGSHHWNRGATDMFTNNLERIDVVQHFHYMNIEDVQPWKIEQFSLERDGEYVYKILTYVYPNQNIPDEEVYRKRNIYEEIIERNDENGNPLTSYILIEVQ